MFDKYTIAVEEVITGFQHDTVGCGHDSGAFRCSDINATVRAAWLLVEKTS